MWKIHEIKNGIRIEKNIDNKTKKDLVRSYIDEKNWQEVWTAHSVSFKEMSSVIEWVQWSHGQLNDVALNGR